MTDFLAALTLAQLVETYNNLADHADKDEVKRFKDKATGQARVAAILVDANELRKADNLPLLAITEGGVLALVEEPKPEPVVEPAKAAKTKPGRAPSIAPSDVIIRVAAANPKKATAAVRFDNYKTGMTVAAYRAAVGCDMQGTRDILWDKKQGWIEVVGADTFKASQAEAAPAN